MWLASVDGAITPADEARIPVTDEGLLRGDGVFEVIRVYGGAPVRLGRAPRAPRPDLRRAAPASRTSTPCAPRRRRCSRRPASPSRCCGSSSRAAAAASRSSSRCPRAGATARVATITYAPTRVLDGLKTLSYAGNMLAVPPREGAGLRRGAARHAARPRARGPDVVVLLGRRTAGCARRRCPRASSTRSPAAKLLRHATSRSARARSTTCAPPRRRSSPRRCARSCRSRRSTTSSCPPAPGPVTRAAHAAFARSSSASSRAADRFT